MFNFEHLENGAVWTAFFGSGAVFFINKNSKQVSQNAIGHFSSGEAEDKCKKSLTILLGYLGTIDGTVVAPLRCTTSEKRHRNGVAKKRHQNNLKRG